MKEQGMWIRWHLTMAAMSLYIGMVCTDWGSGDIINGKFSLTAHAMASKLFTALVTVGVYCWTLLAPGLCPGRNFYYQ